MTALRERQGYALAHPLNQAGGDLAPYRRQTKYATGLLLVTILAVDR